MFPYDNRMSMTVPYLSLGDVDETGGGGSHILHAKPVAKVIDLLHT